MVKCSETHRLEGEALHKLIQAKKFQQSKFQNCGPYSLKFLDTPLNMNGLQALLAQNY